MRLNDGFAELKDAAAVVLCLFLAVGFGCGFLVDGLGGGFQPTWVLLIFVTFGVWDRLLPFVLMGASLWVLSRSLATGGAVIAAVHTGHRTRRTVHAVRREQGTGVVPVAAPQGRGHEPSSSNPLPAELGGEA